MLNSKDLKPGKEQYEKYTCSGLGRKKITRFQYDYRSFSGKLYSSTGKTLEEAKEKVEKQMEDDCDGKIFITGCSKNN